MRRVALKNSQVRASPYSEGVFNLQGDKNINVVEKNWIYINGIKIYKIYTKLQPRKPLANGYFQEM